MISESLIFKKVEKLLEKDEISQVQDLVETRLELTDLDIHERIFLLMTECKILLIQTEFLKAFNKSKEILTNYSEIMTITSKYDCNLLYLESSIRSKKFKKAEEILKVCKFLLEELKPIINNKEYFQFKNTLMIYESDFLLYTWKSDQAIKIALRGLEELEEKILIGDKFAIINSMEFQMILGLVYNTIGDIENASLMFSRSLQIAESLSKERMAARIYNGLAILERKKGELNKALGLYQKSLEICKKFKQNSYIVIAHVNIGNIYKDFEEIELSLKNYFIAIDILDKLKSDLYLGTLYNNICSSYISKGNYELGCEYAKKSLKISKLSNNINSLALTYFNLISGLIFLKDRKQIDEYFEEYTAFFNNLEDKNRTELVIILNKFMKAIIKEFESSLKSQVEAQELYRKIIKENNSYIVITKDAAINLCNLLLFELKIFQNEKTLLEIKELIKNLYKLAQKSKSDWWLVETLLIDSKMALLEVDINKAENLLNNAKNISERKFYMALVTRVHAEEVQLKKKKELWKEIALKESTFSERIELSGIDNLVKAIIANKLGDITKFPTYALDYLHVSFFIMGTTGPEVVISHEVPFEVENRKSILQRMALFYSITLGQGNTPSFGLYGPLPIPEVTDYISMAFTCMIKDKNADERGEGKSFGILVVSVPQILIHFFSDRRKIEKILKKELEDISVDQINKKKFINQIRNKILEI